MLQFGNEQGWRLLQKKRIHCFIGVSKQSIFSGCSFLEAKDTPNSSYVLKSIVATQPILKKGCCWRVGDGLRFE